MKDGQGQREDGCANNEGGIFPAAPGRENRAGWHFLGSLESFGCGLERPGNVEGEKKSKRTKDDIDCQDG